MNQLPCRWLCICLLSGLVGCGGDPAPPAAENPEAGGLRDPQPDSGTEADAPGVARRAVKPLNVPHYFSAEQLANEMQADPKPHKFPVVNVHGIVRGVERRMGLNDPILFGNDQFDLQCGMLHLKHNIKPGDEVLLNASIISVDERDKLVRIMVNKLVEDHAPLRLTAEELANRDDGKFGVGRELAESLAGRYVVVTGKVHRTWDKPDNPPELGKSWVDLEGNGKVFISCTLPDCSGAELEVGQTVTIRGECIGVAVATIGAEDDFPRRVSLHRCAIVKPE